MLPGHLKQYQWIWNKITKELPKLYLKKKLKCNMWDYGEGLSIAVMDRTEKDIKRYVFIRLRNNDEFQIGYSQGLLSQDVRESDIEEFIKKAKEIFSGK